MSRHYTPRRAGQQRWLREAPTYVMDVIDDRRETDRYTVLFGGPDWIEGDRTYAGTWLHYLGLDADGNSFWSELTAQQASAYRHRNRHRRVRWLDLPEHIRAHVITRATETWGVPDVVINPEGRLAILDLRRADEIAPDNSQLMLYAQIIARASATEKRDV